MPHSNDPANNVPDPNDPIDALVGALSQTFVLIALGYVLGATGIVSLGSSKGYTQFLSWVALPAILFSSMATLDFKGFAPLLFFGCAHAAECKYWLITPPPLL